MAVFVLKNTKIYIDGYDLSGKMNNVTLNYTGEMKDKTSFGSSARKRIAGLFSVELSGQAFYSASSSSAYEKSLWDCIGSTGEIYSIFPEGVGASSSTGGSTSLGNIGYAGKKLSYQYNPGYQIGEIASLNFACQGNGPMVRVKTMEAGSISTALTATVRNVGYRKPTEYLYAVFQCLTGTTAAGEKIVVKVQTATSSGFSSTTLSTALKFTAFTTANDTAQWKSTQQSTTHNWYRAVIASSGTTDGGINGVLALGNE